MRWLKDGAVIGNSNAYEDNSPLGVAVSERMGLVKIAKNCGYAIRYVSLANSNLKLIE